MMTKVKTPAEIVAMRRSGAILAQVLQIVKSKIIAGITTKELAEIAARELKNLGGKPAFLGYHGFSDVICISLNDEVVHGIPSSKRKISNGDIVSLDFGVVIDSMITDAAISCIAGKPLNPQHQALVSITETSLMAGIDAIHGATHVGDIAASIQAVLDKAKYGIVRDLVGHGVGHELHEDPNIPNYGRAGKGPLLVPGMTIAIEPMATLGSERVYLDTDGWTVKTADESWSAHFEHTVLITDSGAEILTIV